MSIPSSPHDTFNLRPLADVAVRVTAPALPATSEAPSETFYLNRFPLLSRSGYFREVLLAQTAALAAVSSTSSGGAGAGSGPSGTPVVETVSSDSESACCSTVLGGCGLGLVCVWGGGVGHLNVGRSSSRAHDASATRGLRSPWLICMCYAWYAS